MTRDIQVSSPNQIKGQLYIRAPRIKAWPRPSFAKSDTDTATPGLISFCQTELISPKSLSVYGCSKKRLLTSIRMLLKNKPPKNSPYLCSQCGSENRFHLIASIFASHRAKHGTLHIVGTQQTFMG